MSCKWTFHLALTTAIGLSLAEPSVAQYQDYPSTAAYDTTSRPLRFSALPPVSQTQPASASSYAAPPTAYRPSEMPSVNPFADVRSRRQQTPLGYGESQSQPAAQYQYQSAQPSYSTTAVAYDESRQYPVGGGVTHVPPAYSYYDQPAQSYSQPVDYGFDQKAPGCLVGGASRVRSGWYGGGVGMIMNRSRANNLWLSFDQAYVDDRVLNSNDANFSTAGGAGADIGHYFNCGRNSIQFVYWGIYPGTSEANAYWSDTAGGLGTTMHFDQIDYDAGGGSLDLATFYFNDAERHRVRRSYQANNLELNLLGHNFVSNCSPWQLGWVAGVRYLRFDEDFMYSSDPDDTDFTGSPWEVHYDIDVKNNLIGFQLGGRADYCVSSCLNLYAGTKVGIYGNHISHRSQIYGSNGFAFVADPASPYFPEDVNISSTKNAFSMIGDLSVGGTWSISPCWSINAGYRAVAVTGVALSTNQVPVDYVGALDSLRAIDSNGCLILHGAFAGVNYCY